MLAAERCELDRITGDQRLRHELRVIENEELLRRVSHFLRVVHHQGLRVDRLQHVGRGDVAHVEGRVLAHQDNIFLAEITAALVAQRIVVALLVAHGDVIAGGEQRAAAQRQRLRLVIEQLVPAPLRLQHHGEGRITRDVDGLDRIHLHRYLQAHVTPLPRMHSRYAAASGRGSPRRCQNGRPGAPPGGPPP